MHQAQTRTYMRAHTGRGQARTRARACGHVLNDIRASFDEGEVDGLDLGSGIEIALLKGASVQDSLLIERRPHCTINHDGLALRMREFVGLSGKPATRHLQHVPRAVTKPGQARPEPRGVPGMRRPFHAHSPIHLCNHVAEGLPPGRDGHRCRRHSPL